MSDGSNGGAINRRDLLRSAGVAAAAGALPGLASGASAAGPAAAGSFPKGFLWGASTAGYQNEGNNVSADLWVLENMKPSPFRERSGDACDSYDLWAEDVDLVRQIGLNAYRFSVEWSRVEPEEGCVSIAALDHYRRILARCHEFGITPNVTLHHFASPRWFAARGAWEKADAPDLFARFAERVGKHLGDLIGMAVPFNEPNAPLVIKWSPDMKSATGAPLDVAAMAGPVLKQAARQVGSDSFSFFLMSNPKTTTPAMVRAHAMARTALKSGPGNYPVGAIISIADDQAVDGGEAKVAEKRREVYADWLHAASESDFVGVQCYTRSLIGPEGSRKAPATAEMTKSKWEYYPAALGNSVRYVASQVKVPIYITENGVSTDSDDQRSRYIREALTGLRSAMAAGADVRGYFHWTLVDNWEWNEGFSQTFGLASFDHRTFRRTIKPSARTLGAIAKANRV